LFFFFWDCGRRRVWNFEWHAWNETETRSPHLVDLFEPHSHTVAYKSI
jgi:hypothetical protein